MKMKKILSLAIAVIFFSCSSSQKEKADLIIHNAVIYTADSTFSIAECFAIKDGRIIAVGSSDSIFSEFDGEKFNAQGKALFPGFIDAHCHFYNYGKGLYQADLVGTNSFNEVIERVTDFAKTKKGEWITGRGWDQNDWETKEFPDKTKLDSLFPNTPVFLKRVDGHAALVNSEALRRAGITNETNVDGGKIEHYKSGLSIKGEMSSISNVTGVLVDNAVDLVANKIPTSSRPEAIAALMLAQKYCFEVGITTVDDAGLEKQTVDLIDELQSKGELKMRVYAMLTDNKENLDYYLSHGTYKTDRLNVCSFKFYADGALGSRGACLLHPYEDKPDQQGFLLSKPEYFIENAQKMYSNGFQMNTHCIGDSADRFLLDLYGHVLKGKNDKRWRIEHAQVIHSNDFKKFQDYSIIPSVQSTHATSDMYWAKDRLGPERVKGAYAYKDLLNAFGMVALGTDFPVENINPLYTFYSSVARKDLKGYPDGGFQMENALTREETLLGMTRWAAYSNFEENEKGSIEIGKLADFVILEKDIMKINIDEVPNVKVTHTFVNGELVYPKK